MPWDMSCRGVFFGSSVTSSGVVAAGAILLWFCGAENYSEYLGQKMGAPL